MNIFDSISLIVIMVTLAAIPSTSVALVVTRSATHGVANGIAVSTGIVVGDLIFIVLAVTGLSFVAQSMGWLFMTIKYIGGAYLIWLGINLLISKNNTINFAGQVKQKSGCITSFLAGLFLTLGDIKAIFFYVSLFPTFVELSSLSKIDLFIIVVITIIAVGGVKIFYAISAHKLVSLSNDKRLQTVTKKTAGGFMLGAGGYLILKA